MKNTIGAALLVCLAVADVSGQSRVERDRASMGDQGDATVKFRGIGWVVLRSPNRERLAEFYRALGFVQASVSTNVIGFYCIGNVRSISSAGYLTTFSCTIRSESIQECSFRTSGKMGDRPSLPP